MIKYLLEYILKLIEAIDWPIFLIFVAWQYSNEFKSILARLENAKLGGVEVNLLKEKSNEITEIVKNTLSLPDFQKIQLDDVLVADVDNDGISELIILAEKFPSVYDIKIFKPIILDMNSTHNSLELIGEILNVSSLKELRHLDSDGNMEIVVDENGDDNYFYEVKYKFVNGNLLEVSRKKIQIAITQYEINDVAEEDFKNAESKMNNLITEIIYKLDSDEDKQKFQEAQNSWIIYRKLQTELICLNYTGSIKPTIYYSYMTGLTKIRIYELDKIAHAGDGYLGTKNWFPKC